MLERPPDITPRLQPDLIPDLSAEHPPDEIPGRPRELIADFIPDLTTKLSNFFILRLCLYHNYYTNVNVKTGKHTISNFLILFNLKLKNSKYTI